MSPSPPPAPSGRPAGLPPQSAGRASPWGRETVRRPSIPPTPAPGPVHPPVPRLALQGAVPAQALALALALVDEPRISVGGRAIAPPPN